VSALHRLLSVGSAREGREKDQDQMKKSHVIIIIKAEKAAKLE